MKSKPAFVAHEVPLSTRIFPRPQPVNDIFILVNKNAASCAAIGADALLGPQEPDTLLVKEILTAKCAHRAKIDHVAGQLVIEGLAWEDVNFGMIAPVRHL